MFWHKAQKVVFALFLGLIIVSLIFYWIYKDSIDPEQIRILLKDFGILAPIIFIFLYTIGTIFIPSTPFMIAAGLLFGFKYGLLYTVVGGFLSSIMIFGFSRRLGKTKVEEILKHKYLKHLDEYNKRLETGAIWDLIVLRMMPIMPFNVLNVLMGLSKIKTVDYVAGTLLGLVPSNILTVYFGNFLVKIF